MQYKDNLNGIITLDKKLASSGESIVYYVKDSSNLLAKIYHNKLTPNKTEKLHFISRNSFPQLESFASIPKELLYNNGE